MGKNNFFLPENVIYLIKTKSKSEVIKQLMVPLMCCKEIKKQKDNLITALVGRENQGSTAIQNEIAIPHFRSSSVKKNYFTLGVSKEGIPFDSFDKKPSKIFLLTIFSAGQEEFCLKFLSKASRFFYNKETREKIYKSVGNQEVWEITKEIFT